MTRFAATEPRERRKLIVDAITAHRERGSDFLTVEADPVEGESREAPATDDESEADDESDDPTPPPWIQFADRTFNLDCTDEELARLDSLLEEFPEFRIDQRASPENADGTNVRITARSDANRLASFVDRAFRTVYGRGEDYRLWAVEV